MILWIVNIANNSLARANALVLSLAISIGFGFCCSHRQWAAKIVSKLRHALFSVFPTNFNRLVARWRLSAHMITVRIQSFKFAANELFCSVCAHISPAHYYRSCVRRVSVVVVRLVEEHFCIYYYYHYRAIRAFVSYLINATQRIQLNKWRTRENTRKTDATMWWIECAVCSFQWIMCWAFCIRWQNEVVNKLGISHFHVINGFALPSN